MEALGILLAAVGLLLLLGAQLHFIVLGFRESALTGVGVLLFPVIGIVLALLRLPESKGGVIAFGAGTAALILGLALQASGT
jgi:hypothetical protein